MIDLVHDAHVQRWNSFETLDGMILPAHLILPFSDVRHELFDSLRAEQPQMTSKGASEANVSTEFLVASERMRHAETAKGTCSAVLTHTFNGNHLRLEPVWLLPLSNS